ncbi:hypothetical protein SAMN04488102_104268 [Alkalibacterium subtropicum]|uniref:Uncharacterized protein n=1 Tax=Alkalibacterium subtropicum TaxID=753702 RepID=A0A1I1I0I3_9LACT|nr:hypothetical protein [Alkalibacterium subtropicum]SFC29827.1 hypothetical protein SAMN04488102_104268 [Alkalibacterium subtropicum]
MHNHKTTTPVFTYIWLPLYVFLQLTWGLIQTVAGFILFLFHIKSPHDFYHGCIRTKWATFNGISLGLFIFVPNDEDENLLKRKKNNTQLLTNQCDRVSVHEYGHTYQSIMLGPLYLIIIGTVSWSWARRKRYKDLRRKYGVPYSFCWTEAWANALGERILKEPSITH